MYNVLDCDFQILKRFDGANVDDEICQRKGSCRMVCFVCNIFPFKTEIYIALKNKYNISNFIYIYNISFSSSSLAYTFDLCFQCWKMCDILSYSSKIGLSLCQNKNRCVSTLPGFFCNAKNVCVILGGWVGVFTFYVALFLNSYHRENSYFMADFNQIS